MQANQTKNIVIAGVGGQGNILAAKILAEAAGNQGKEAIVGEVYGESQRGGSVASHVRIGDHVMSPLSPEHSAHVICGLEPMEALRAAKQYTRPDSVVFINTRAHYPVGVNMGKKAYPHIEDIIGALNGLAERVVALDAMALALKAGAAVLTNVVMIGAMSTDDSLGLTKADYEEAVRCSVPKNRDLNLKAFRMGWEACHA